MKTVRILISSPGDVADERDRAQSVVARLQRFYGPTLRLEVLRWEDLPLQSDASFQQGIDSILSERGVDVAVFILWARLGSPLGPAINRPDGTPFRSGTEREFALMLTAREASGGKRPAILAYVRQDDAAFFRRLEQAPASERETLWEQSRLARGFVTEQFHDEHGHNVRAFHTFDAPLTFARRLETHLKELLADCVTADGLTARWSRAPFRGLARFELDDAAIFFGRDREVLELEERLRERARRSEPAFVCVVGASGSGKSSLVRAGLAASLRSEGDDAASSWRTVTLLPRGRLIKTLAQALVAIPELADVEATSIEEGLETDPSLAVRLALSPRLGQARVVLIVDQLEEVFTAPGLDVEQRAAFWSALEALARSGSVWVVSTLRSDFYAHAQREPGFLALKGVEGHFDLTRPGDEAMATLIEQPAALAGVRFERRGEVSLEARIRREAQRQPDALPLVQHLLLELWERRSAEGVLTIEAYDALGGVAGAIARHADAVIAKLDPKARTVLPRVLRQLVQLNEEGVATARQVELSVFEADTAEARLLDAAISERLLLVDEGRVRVTHEALLAQWPVARELIDADRERLVVRTRLETAARRWEAEGKHPDRLLPDGLPLQEAVRLVSDWPGELPPLLTDFIGASRRQVARRRSHRRALVIAVSFVALMLIGWTWLESERAFRASFREREATGRADQQEREALAARLETATVRGTATRISVDLFNQLAQLPFDSTGEYPATALTLLARMLTELSTDTERFTIEGHSATWCLRSGDAPDLAPPQWPITRCVFGFTDEYALLISSRMAASMKRAAVQSTNDPTLERRLDTVGYGNTRPRVEYPTTGTAGDWNKVAQQNNRVELRRR